MKPTKNLSPLDQLRKDYHSAQGAVNYWSNAARAAQKDCDRHEGERQASDTQRLAQFQNKVDQANARLDQIKAQLNELDPQGAQARQASALRKAIHQITQQLAALQATAAQPENLEFSNHWQQRIAKKRAKLAQLIEAQQRLETHAQRHAADRQSLQDHLALAAKPYHYRPPFERPHSDLSHLAITAPQAPPDDQVGADHRQVVLDALQRAIDEATARGDLQEAERLSAAWIWQAELQADDQVNGQPAASRTPGQPG